MDLHPEDTQRTRDFEREDEKHPLLRTFRTPLKGLFEDEIQFWRIVYFDEKPASVVRYESKDESKILGFSSQLFVVHFGFTLRFYEEIEPGFAHRYDIMTPDPDDETEIEALERKKVNVVATGTIRRNSREYKFNRWRIERVFRVKQIKDSL